VKARKPPPGLRPGRVWGERKLSLKLLGRDIPFVLLGENPVNLVANLGKVFHVESGIVQPWFGKWARGPVGRRVFLGEAQPQDVFHDALESHAGEARESGAEFSVKECHWVNAGFTEAGKILVSGVDDPLEV
jgi:hypothetical protein